MAQKIKDSFSAWEALYLVFPVIVLSAMFSLYLWTELEG